MYGTRMDARERLIESTRELLWERGYVGTSPKAIQERSGAGQGSMYHHFSGKQDLALAAIRRNAADLTSRMDADLAGPGSVIERRGMKAPCSCRMHHPHAGFERQRAGRVTVEARRLLRRPVLPLIRRLAKIAGMRAPPPPEIEQVPCACI